MSGSVAAQVAAVREELETRPPGLVRHVERVLAEALDLATRWDLDPMRVQLAAWGHDLFRSFPEGEQLRFAAEAGLRLSDDDRASPIVLHGPIAAVVLRERFAVSDREALAAVREHTLGAPGMPTISKVILLADKFEKRKRDRTPVMREIRRLARRDLDLALLCWADWKWVDEREHAWPSHASHWNARTAWVAEHLADRRTPTLRARASARSNVTGRGQSAPAAKPGRSPP